MASNRANMIYGSEDMAGLEMEQKIEKAMKDHNLKKITATNYYYEWNREQKVVSEDEAVGRILDIISEKPQPELVAEVIEDDEKKADEVIVEKDAAIKAEGNRFKMKMIHFSGVNGEYYIDNDTFMLSNPEGSLTFANESDWNAFKAEIDAAFDYTKNMEVLICE